MKLLSTIVATLLLVLGTGPALGWEEEDFYAKPTLVHRVSKSESMIGDLRWYRVRKGDTLFDIARQESLGYNEIVDRNPGLDVWLPPPGAVVLMPTWWILPCCAREGLVINIPEMRLYYYRPVPGDPGSVDVLTYGVGLGRDDWRTPQGKFKIRDKTVNPTWVIPESIRKEHIEERGDARTAIPGGAPDNPLGKHRLSLTLPSYGIHGTNIPWGVGMQVSHGCLRLYPEDIERLYPDVPVGTPGEFVYQPVKVGLRDGEVYVQVARDIYGLTPAIWKEATAMLKRLGVADRVDRDRLMDALRHPIGIPVKLTGPPDGSARLARLRFLERRTDARIERPEQLAP
jgi:L,D-transpeptidase ErfK/SrfK